MRQRGSTLIVSLIVLVLLMLIGVAAMLTSDNQYRMSGNLQFESDALNRVENVVTTAESWLANAPPMAEGKDPRFQAPQGPTNPERYPRRLTTSDPAAPDPLASAWDASNSIAPNPAAPDERYRVEQIGQNLNVSGDQAWFPGAPFPCNRVNTYRATARADANRGASKTVQSVYSVLNCS
jgi:Tfp pilus assembly protein PilX